MFPHGVYYIPLASITTAELIVPAIAEALGFSFSGPVDPKEQLINYMSGNLKQSFLLVLDNLEHLIVPSSDAVEFISEILQRLPSLKILATSRERLNLRGEWMYELHGLPVPPTAYVERLDDYSAATLFIQSARRVKTDFKITTDEKPALVRICHLLEGIPLAIELAAAWTGMLSCEEIAGEIESNIGFLETTMRAIPERHRSLRASFDHSWKLLSGEEQKALCRLAVFQGGFDRAAAERVAGATLALLASLVAKSLVRRAENGRYDLHEVIRQFALSQLDEDLSNQQEARDAHSEYYLQFAADRKQALRSAPQQKAARELIGEIDNLRAAWVWAIRHEKFSLLGASVRSLGWFFEVSGLIREGIEQFEPLVRVLKAKSQHLEWHWVLGQALTQQGMLYFRKGHLDRAQMLIEESLYFLRPLGKKSLLTDPLVYLGVLLHINGEIQRSRTLMEEGLACARSAGDDWFLAYAVYNLGYIDSLTGQFAEGREQMLEGISIWRRLGDPHSIALGLNYLGPTLVKLGCYEQAESFLEESLRLCTESGNRWGKGTAYRYLALVKMAQGQLGEARSLLQKSLDTFGDYIVGWDIARSYTYLGEVALLSGEIAEARKIYLQALSLANEARSIPLMLDALIGLAFIDAKSGNLERALQVSNLIISHSAGTQETKDRANRLKLEIDESLDHEQARAIKEKVLPPSLEDIVNTLVVR
jgi:predicted ATPase